MAAMADSAPAHPRTKRRMLVWMVILPAALLLLALAGANWKVFHLAYARRLLTSGDKERHSRGVELTCRHHLHKGMLFKKVRRLLDPLEMHCSVNEGTWANFKVVVPPGASYELYLNVEAHETLKEWKLKSWHFYPGKQGKGQ